MVKVRIWVNDDSVDIEVSHSDYQVLVNFASRVQGIDLMRID